MTDTVEVAKLARAIERKLERAGTAERAAGEKRRGSRECERARGDSLLERQPLR